MLQQLKPIFWDDVPNATKCSYRHCERPVIQTLVGRKKEFCCGGCRKNEHMARRRDEEAAKQARNDENELRVLGVPEPMFYIVRQYQKRYGQAQAQDLAWLIGRAVIIDRENRYTSGTSPAVTKGNKRESL